MREHEPIFLLRGVGGSHAHGLATATSDRDLIGMYSYPTEAFWSLNQPPETITGHEPEDHSYHELAKFLRLAAKSNPTVLELLWLDEYDERDEWGNWLREIRRSFNTAHDVRNAYIGYAESQFRKMMQAGNSDSRARSPKNARHMIRLMEQGQHLYTTGELLVKVPDRARYRAYEGMTVEALQKEFVDRWSAFLGAKTVLPEEPDWKLINAFLREYRRKHV